MTAVVKKELLLMVGEDVDNQIIIQLYDIEADEWYPENLIKNQIIGKCGTAFALVQTKLYFLDEKTKKSGEVCYFDLESNLVAHPGIKYADAPAILQLVAINRRLYFVEPVTAMELYYFDIDSKKMAISSPDIGGSDYSRCFTSANGLIYIFHPQKSEGLSFNPETGLTAKTSKIKQWPQLSGGPVQGPEKIVATEMKGKIYAVAEHSLSKIYIYSPAEDKWETIEAKNSPSFVLGKLTSCNDKLIAVSGQCFINIFDFEKKKWDYRRDMNGSMVGCRAVFSVKKPAVKLD